MTAFSFSDNDRIFSLHTFNNVGEYIGVIDTPVKAHMGLPAATIDGDLITENNPLWNFNFKRVEYSDDAGAKWFLDENGTKISIHTNSILEEPPIPAPGYAIIWKDGAYQELEDHQGKTSYSTSTQSSLIIEELGEIAAGYTLSIPPSKYYHFIDDAWVYSQELERPDKLILMQESINVISRKILDAIEQHRIDQEVPSELKSTNPIDDNQLLELYTLRKVLHDLPDDEDFPFVSLPELPQWLN